MRTADELAGDDAGADEVRRLLADAKNPIEVLRGTKARGARALVRTQVPTSTLLGAFAYRLGGLLVDYGFLRVLGGGAPKLERDLASWNGLASPRLPGALLVADDALGGFFALDEGAFGGPRGGVFYASPEGDWEELELDYAGFFAWATDGDLDAFYGDARFDDWELEVARLPTDVVLGAVDAATGRRARARIEDVFDALVLRRAR